MYRVKYELTGDGRYDHYVVDEKERRMSGPHRNYGSANTEAQGLNRAEHGEPRQTPVDFVNEYARVMGQR